MSILFPLLIVNALFVIFAIFNIGNNKLEKDIDSNFSFEFVMLMNTLALLFYLFEGYRQPII